MKTIRFIITGLLLSLGANLVGQPYNKPHSLQIYLDNDFLNFRGDGTDRYFTNGIRVDYYYIKQTKPKFPSSFLLKISETDNLYSWGIAQFMFTPKHIDLSEVQINDRPYAGALYAIHKLQSVNQEKDIKLTTELFIGVIGSLSFAKESQTLLHEIINYTKPEGWDNQIPNDFILNYNISIEKQILNPSQNLSLSGWIETFSGTLYNAAGIGFLLKVGKFNNYFEDTFQLQVNPKNKFELNVFMQPVARIVLSNALLEGGLIYKLRAKNDSYTLSKDEIERLTFLYNVGINIRIQKLSVSISQKLWSAEFKGQYVQEVGNITLKIKI